MGNRALGAASAFALLAAAATTSAVEGRALYQTHCAGCHGERGEGGNASPLAGNEAVGDGARLRRLIQRGAGDMPGFPHLAEGELSGLVGFVQTSLGTTGSEGPAYAPGNAIKGLAYFTGRAPLSARGAACAGCHSAGRQPGGALGRDLSGTTRRFKSEEALAGALTRSAFPVMRAAYAERAVTPTEAADLAAYLLSPGTSSEVGTSTRLVWLAGAAGTVALFVIAGAAGSRRGKSPAQRLRRAGRREKNA